MMRIGIGYDIHRLVKNRPLLLGGVNIPYSKGLIGHSDADVLLHSVGDAILGASGEPDIGELFCDSDARFKNISSLELLKKIHKRITRRKIKIINIDSVIIIEQPKIASYKYLMRKNISSVLNIGINRVNIKAKTQEKLPDALGARQAVAVYTVALIKK